MKAASTILIVTIASLFPLAAMADDAAYGRRLAENWCASCHAVSADARSTNPHAPPFGTIAKSSDFSAEHLAYLLLDPHPKMAKLVLSRRAINDIAAYISSLK
jgi:mono/diheme cytochrome c family protein